MRNRMIHGPTLVDIQSRCGLTTVELARRAEVSRSMLNDVRAGRHQLSDQAAHRVARVLGCDIDDFTRPFTADEQAYRDGLNSRRRANLARNREHLTGDAA